MYTPLKVTTDYSLLKSLIKIDDLITFLLFHNIKACGLCDDNLYGWMEFYTKCRAHHIKPILGLNIKIGDLDVYLYAKNYAGFQNLIKIATLKQEKELEIKDLMANYQNILVILPYQSYRLKELLNLGEDLYFSYANAAEKSQIKEKSIYLNDIKALKKEDLIYLNYLDFLAGRDKTNYENNFYQVQEDDTLKKEIISKLNVEIPLNKRYIPQYTENSALFLQNLSFKGLTKRLNGQITDIYQKRLAYELNIINKMGYADYFLIVYDYVLYAKKKHILVGPGRGSAAGSLVSYAIGITEIDPVKNGLIFERFLNPERITMPDIDIDFDASRREEVINYVKEKYGFLNVAKGITFATYKAKLVLRDVAKILKIDNYLLERFIKNIKADLNLQENLKNDIIKKYLNNYPELKKLYQIAWKLEELKKNVSTHAAAVVISSVPLTQIIPIYKNGEEIITGTTDYLETLGLLKMDFLGLRNLTIIKEVLTLIGQDALPKLDYQDSKVLAIFNTIDVEGIFQFETGVMQKFLTHFKIDSFTDLVAALALVRPGPKDYIELYNRRKKGLEKISYITPDLEPILKETYGIILYQEQIMAILNKVGGYSYGEADIIRRAISKKKEEVIQEEKAKFLKRAQARNYDTHTANLIYDDIAKFAGYGFNKSHSVAYATISYQMAYLKAYYYPEFILVLLNKASKNEVNRYLNLLKKRHLKIVKPSILTLNQEYVIKNNSLFIPLTLISKVTKDTVLKLEAVKGDNFHDLFDFFKKTYNVLSREVIEALIQAGALDCFKYNHPTLLNNLDNIYNYLALVEGEEDLIAKPEIIMAKDFTEEQKREEEIKSFGFYLTNHPASKYQATNIIKIENIKNFMYQKINMVLLITKITNIKTKKNEDMAFLEAEDETGSISLTVFPLNFNLIKKLKINDIIWVRGEVAKRFDKYQIIVNNIKKDGENNE